MKEVVHHTAYMGWSELRDFSGPADVKVLRDDPESGAKTMLVRIPPGGEVNPHGHRGIVQHAAARSIHSSWPSWLRE